MTGERLVGFAILAVFTWMVAWAVYDCATCEEWKPDGEVMHCQADGLCYPVKVRRCVRR